MDEQNLRTLLHTLQEGQIDISEVVECLRRLPTESLTSACLDHHRILRTGMPEAVLAEHKTTNQLIEILTAQLRQPNVVLATRVAKDKARAVCKAVDKLRYHESARMLTGNEQAIPEPSNTTAILLVTAGTSDLPVAEEARITLYCLGRKVTTIYDAGVAGIHRILEHQKILQQAPVIIVVAGMEGALPSVIAGITPAPVIGVPTSIGYGTGAGGFSALLGMLNSCAPGLAVVNIDNGFGAACMAAAITRNLSPTTR
ncbi:MAG TPA: nickel pincer cofactor biosynthesis protein LarB [Desulfobulbaceae bacterium]|nr:nickel pincer cofactor biosynthesis protein LarB [Desulfobulbaceae bacterium]